MKRIVSLLAAVAVVAATLFVVVPFASARTAATTIKVTAKDFKFVLSKKSATHDFKIAGKKTKLLGPGKSATLTVTLKKGKKYTYICTVPGHVQLGMKGSFKAT